MEESRRAGGKTPDDIGERENALLKVRELLAQGRGSEAVDLADLLVKAYPNDLVVEYERASAIGQSMPPRIGLYAAESFAQKFPGHFAGQILLGCASLRLNQGEKALKYFQEASERGATNDMLMSVRATGLAKTGRRREALGMLGEASDLESLRLKFDARPPKDQLELNVALDALRTAGESEAKLAIRASSWYAAQKMWSEAEAVLVAAATTQPSSLLSEQLAWIEFRLGRRRAAVERLGALLASDPRNLRARRSAAWFSLLSGQLRLFFSHLFAFQTCAWRRLAETASEGHGAGDPGQGGDVDDSRARES